MSTAFLVRGISITVAAAMIALTLFWIGLIPII